MRGRVRGADVVSRGKCRVLRRADVGRRSMAPYRWPNQYCPGCPYGSALDLDWLKMSRARPAVHLPCPIASTLLRVVHVRTTSHVAASRSCRPTPLDQTGSRALVLRLPPRACSPPLPPPLAPQPEATPWGVALGVLGGWQRLLDNGALLAPDQAAQAGQAGVGGLRNGSYYAACARRLGRFTNQRLAGGCMRGWERR